MRRLAIIWLTVIFCAGNSFSQEDSNAALNFDKTKNLNHYLKVNPFSLLEVEASVMLGYSYPVNKGKAQWQHEIGYVFLNEAYFLSYDNDIAFSGFKIRNNYRSYFDSNSNYEDSMRNPYNRFYFGFDMMYKYCKYLEYDVNYWMLGGQFTQLLDVGHEKHVGALHFVTGVETNIIKNSNSILDFYIGLGLRFKTVNATYNGASSTNLESEFVQSSRLWYDDMEIPMNVSIMAGMKIGFGL